MSELENVDKKKENSIKWGKARWGVILICFIHLMVSGLASGAEPGSAQSKLVILPVFFNYWIASLYINHRIEKGKEEQNLFMMGVKAAGVVFIVQVVLGAIYLSIIMK